MPRTISDRVAYIWNAALERATGAGHAKPFDYADEQARDYTKNLSLADAKKLARGE